MKYMFILVMATATLLFGACKNYNSDAITESRNDSLMNSPASVTLEKYSEGARLFAANDCVTCHNIEKPLFGPSLLQIAAKYNNDESLATFLANSVRRGSKGVFGKNAMPAHPNMQHEDIVAINQFILSLRPNTEQAQSLIENQP